VTRGGDYSSLFRDRWGSRTTDERKT